jgi:arylsulfatase A-like enzyme
VNARSGPNKGEAVKGNRLLTTRRDFCAAAAAVVPLAMADRSLGAQAGRRPNILWLVSEDNNPYIGAYGDPIARTPTIDRLAREGVLYENCFSQAPVCAPSRFTIITGLYATSCGPANHMRASGKGPAGMRGFPAYLRESGYYCTNNAKTDYNAPVDLKDAWNESSRQAHWRKRPEGKPFFAVFNHEITHESQVFPANQAKYTPLASPTDPASVRLPAYIPDTPETRRDRANYYNQMARLDEQVSEKLRELEEAGLADDTIVFYYGDNGGVLPRSKRFAYDSGLHVPLIVRFPEKWKHLAPAAPGSRIQDPISFVDFAPTVLSLAGVPAPRFFQGMAFAGPGRSGSREYAFSFRDRMDERYDMVRTARDRRYRYIRNYKPHLAWGRHVEYMWQQTGVAVWEKLYREGRLSGPQVTFWQEKPHEELYDLYEDPDEVRNLVSSGAHQDVLGRMRAVLEKHLLEIRDNGFIPEGSALEGYDATRNRAAYPLERILAAAGTVSLRRPENLSRCVEMTADGHECIRYWGALGCVMLGKAAAPAADALSRLLEDPSGSVRVAAAEALCRCGRIREGLAALEDCLLRHDNARVRLQAADALDSLGPAAARVLPALEKAAADSDDYVRRSARHTASVLGSRPA